MENVRKTFKGEILIIDDEVNDDSTDIYKIKHYLEINHFHVLSYDSFPVSDEIDNLNIAFMICDWKFKDGDEDYNAEQVISFLNQITRDRLFPIFICTSLDKQFVKDYLLSSCEKFKDNMASCIFVVNKNEIQNEKIFEIINQWLANNPSIKTMKAWERAIDRAKEKLFSDLYNESEYWPLVLYQSFEVDGDDANEEMGQFLSRNLFSRVNNTYTFEKFARTEDMNIDLLKILDGERTFYYQDEIITDDTLLHTGDIFESAGKLFINIKRQCDLIRNNVDVYLLSLESAGNMVNAPIRLSDDKKHLLILGVEYEIESKPLQKINTALDKAFGKTNALYQGKFLEKNYEVIIPCVYHLDVCRINLRSLKVISIETLKTDYKRKARLLEPYINIVTEKFATYVSSKGTMRTPEALLTHKFLIRDIDEE